MNTEYICLVGGLSQGCMIIYAATYAYLSHSTNPIKIQAFNLNQVNSPAKQGKMAALLKMAAKKEHHQKYKKNL